MSVAGRPVIAWTPYGRERTVSVLAAYMRRDHDAGILDEWWLCMNTDPGPGGEDDRLYAHKLAAGHDWIRRVERLPAWGPQLRPIQYNTKMFFHFMNDPQAVYIRFDDDIVYVHPAAVSRLAAAARPEVFAAFPVIINNAVVSWFLQAQGRLPDDVGQVGPAPYCMDPAGWADAGFAERLHRAALAAIEEGRPEDFFLYTGVQLPYGQQFSVSCFALRGGDTGFIPDSSDDEHWVSITRPGQLNRPNVIVPDALVSHLTFYPHRDAILATDILDQYRALAARDCAVPAPL